MVCTERMKIFRSRGFNHHSPSSTDQTKLPEGTKQTTTNRYDAKISTTKCANGYVKKSIYAKIGNGEEVFNRAKEVVLTGQLTNSIPWCRLIRIPPTSKHMQIGDTIATLIQFYKLPVWSLNPCHVVDVIHQQTSSSSKRVLVKYSTLQGHLLQGEESFEVRISPSIGGQDAASKRSEVHFEMVTYSKASGLLGSLCLPLIRPLQDKFLQSHVQSCLQLIQQQQ